MSGDVVPRSEGQRLLLLQVGSLRQLARRLGASSAQGINEWRRGIKIPSPQFRAVLEAQWAIPASSWCEPPLDPATAPPTAAIAPITAVALVPSTAPAPHTLDECARLLTHVRTMAGNEQLAMTERLRFADSEARILALQARLQQASELRETRYCFEHPAFLRAVRTITDALHPHPQAARAVAAALDGLGVAV